LQGKVALVTGGGSGIGTGIAVQLAKAGAQIVICGRTASKLEDADRMIKGLGASCTAVPADVKDESSCNKLVQDIISQHGHLDILVNNAGIEGPGACPMEQLSASDFDDLFQTNVRSQFLLCKAVIPHMKERAAVLKAEYPSFEESAKGRPHAGSIINLSSIAGKRGFNGLAVYSATNFARIGLTRSLALELAPYHINVNALLPGIVWTEIWDRLADGMAKESGGDKMTTFQQSVEALIPMHRPQLVEEMGDLAVYFASQPNVTGQEVAVDGGYTA
jgi:meso-butanediol dehydrogenase/(S,S)-butanediol dehydrogenase/diacetyl reductase